MIHGLRAHRGMCMCVCVCVSVCMCLYVCVYVCICVCVWCDLCAVCVHVPVFTCTGMCTSTFMHTGAVAQKPMAVRLKPAILNPDAANSHSVPWSRKVSKAQLRVL